MVFFASETESPVLNWAAAISCIDSAPCNKFHFFVSAQYCVGELIMELREDHTLLGRPQKV